MKDDTIEMESVLVEVDGALFDIVSFSDHKAAEAYKRAIRRWADKAGMTANLWTQKATVAANPHQRLSSQLKMDP